MARRLVNQDLIVDREFVVSLETILAACENIVPRSTKNLPGEETICTYLEVTQILELIRVGESQFTPAPVQVGTHVRGVSRGTIGGNGGNKQRRQGNHPQHGVSREVRRMEGNLY